MEYKGAFKSALEEYKTRRPSALDEPVEVKSHRIPIRSDTFKCVFHLTSSDFSTNSSIDTIREIKTRVAEQLLNEIAHWKSKILSLPDVKSAEFEDRVSVTVGSTEIRGEAFTLFRSFNGLMIDPHLEYIEIAHAPDTAWHRGE